MPLSEFQAKAFFVLVFSHLYLFIVSENYIFPTQVKSGQTVAIIAPSGPVERSALNDTVSALESWGLRVAFGKSTFHNTGYLAGSDDDRLAYIQWAINDDEIDLILCARGGFGATKILDQINFSNLLVKPKWLIGYSDITAIHLAMQDMGYGSVHGPMATSFQREGAQGSVNALKQWLFENIASPIESTQSSFNKIGQASGPITGGNLALIVDSLGTASEIQTDHKLLFIEDIGEPMYKIDRMLTQLKRAGKFDNASGLIIGDFSELNDTTAAQYWQDVVIKLFDKFDFPIGFGFPIGHEPMNMPIIMGKNYQLKVLGDRALLILDEDLPR